MIMALMQFCKKHRNTFLTHLISTPNAGIPELRQAVAAHNKRFYGLDIDWKTETMVSSGATEGLAACFLGF